MAYRKGAKNLQAEVDAKVKDAFSKQCKQRGQVQHDAVTGALRVWLALPHAVQSELISRPPRNVYEFLIDRLVNVQISKRLDELGPLKLEFLRLLEQAGEQGGK